MKLLLSLIVVVGLGAGGYFLWKKSSTQQANNRVPNRPTTATVEARDIRFAVSAAGDIGPADQVSVRPEVNGRIAELPVDIGDKVAKDALLCRLDDKDLQIERSSRLAEIDGAKLQLQKAMRNFTRFKQLFTDRLISQEQFDDSKTDYDLATNAIQRALSALDLVEDRLSKTKILAPFDCTVLIRPVSLGQTVSGSAGFNAGTEIMSIANLNEMVVNAHINQADVIRLKQGRDVEIQAESVPGVRMKGVVERIAPQAVIKNGIKGFSARIAIKDIDSRVRPGMTAILNIPVSSADNVLAVPLAAVFTENGERFVFVKSQDKFERRPITIGVADYAFAEVIQGLNAGEIVALDPSVNQAGAGTGPSAGGRPGGQRSRGDRPGVSATPGGGRREGGQREGTPGGSRRREGSSNGGTRPGHSTS